MLELWLDLPGSDRDVIDRCYSSLVQRKEALLEVYVHEHPCPSWQRIVKALHHLGLYDKANVVEKTYVKGVLTSINVQP